MFKAIGIRDPGLGIRDSVFCSSRLGVAVRGSELEDQNPDSEP